jgi:hypothetical protein
MPGSGRHWIVDGDDRQRAHGVALLLHHVHLRNLFIQRATGQGYAKNGLLELAGFLFQAGGAAVLALIVALDAVIGLIERAFQTHPRIGQPEPFPFAPVFLGKAQLGDSAFVESLHRHQMERIQLVRDLE